MKKYLSGIVAVILAVVAFSFTTVKSSGTSATSNVADPCDPSARVWFVLQATCAQQQVFTLDNYLNVNNYEQFTEAGEPDCPGSVCVCAILACPKLVGTAIKPDFGTVASPTTIRTEIGKYFAGQPYNTSLILEKDQ